MKEAIVLAMLLSAAPVAADAPIRLNFAVVALIADPVIRKDFEDELVRRLHAARFPGAAASHPHVAFTGGTVSRSVLVGRLERRGFAGALVVRPIAVGPDTQRITLDTLPPPVADTIGEFLSGLDQRPDWSAAVQVGAFLLGSADPVPFWRGVSWVEEGDRPSAAKQLAEVIVENAVQARAEFRRAHQGLTGSDPGGAPR